MASNSPREWQRYVGQDIIYEVDIYKYVIICIYICVFISYLVRKFTGKGIGRQIAIIVASKLRPGPDESLLQPVPPEPEDF